MLIYVRCLFGTAELKVSELDDVGTLKTMVEERFDIANDRQSLIYLGKVNTEYVWFDILLDKSMGISIRLNIIIFGAQR